MDEKKKVVMRATGEGTMSDMQKIIARYAERFGENDTAVKKIICLDLVGEQLDFGDFLYEEFNIVEDDYPQVFGQWWEEPGEDMEPGGIADMLCSERGGWLLEALTPLPRDVKFRVDGRPQSWRTGGVYAETTVYAPTLPEALERLAVTCERRVKQEFAKARALRGLPTPEASA